MAIDIVARGLGASANKKIEGIEIGGAPYIDGNLWYIWDSASSSYKNSGVAASGQDGVGIKEIKLTETEGLVDTYTIAFDNNTTATYTVKNGMNGQDGKDAVAYEADEETLHLDGVKFSISETYKNKIEKIENELKDNFVWKEGLLGEQIETIEQNLIMKLNGKSIQEGEPTPLTPKLIKNIGSNGSIKIVTELNGELSSEQTINLNKPLAEADYLKTEDMKVYRNTNTLILNGSENWQMLSQTYVNRYYITTLTDSSIIGSSSKNYIKSTHYKEITSNVDYSNINYDCIAIHPVPVAGVSTTLVIFDTRKLSVEDFKSWLAENNVEVLYKTNVTKIEDLQVENQLKLQEGLSTVKILDEEVTTTGEISYKTKYDYISTAPVYVDGINGSDDSLGNEENPFKTISRALETDSENLIITPGDYYETINISNKDRITISANVEGFSSENENNPKVKIINAKELNFTQADGLYETEGDFSYFPRLKQVFLDKTLEPFMTTPRVAPNVALWEVDTIDTAGVQLNPVLTKEQLSEKGSFFYDGQKLYINPNNENKKYYLSNEESRNTIRIYKCKEVSLNNISAYFSYYNTSEIWRCDNVNIHSCKSAFSALSNGFSLDYSNANVLNSEAYNCYNDGFNIHGNRSTNFINCSGHDNRDDGVSHHDGCVGFINGGEWYNNGKGGISSPTYGALVNVYNAISHTNAYGIYAVNVDDTANNFALVGGCWLHNNVQSDLHINNYNIKGYNNNYDKKTVVNNGTLTETVLPSGKSAYEIALENGFLGTELEWLESLVGEPGVNGTNGRDGLTTSVKINGQVFEVNANGEVELPTVDIIVTTADGTEVAYKMVAIDG